LSSSKSRRTGDSEVLGERIPVDLRLVPAVFGTLTPECLDDVQGVPGRRELVVGQAARIAAIPDERTVDEADLPTGGHLQPQLEVMGDAAFLVEHSRFD